MRAVQQLLPPSLLVVVMPTMVLQVSFESAPSKGSGITTSDPLARTAMLQAALVKQRVTFLSSELQSHAGMLCAGTRASSNPKVCDIH